MHIHEDEFVLGFDKIQMIAQVTHPFLIKVRTHKNTLLHVLQRHKHYVYILHT